jgi:hypothetical protein
VDALVSEFSYHITLGGRGASSVAFNGDSGFYSLAALWMTFKQAQEFKAHVRKRERGNHYSSVRIDPASLAAG